jgi:hypothetical protein
VSAEYDIESLTEGYFCPMPTAWDRIYTRLMALWKTDSKVMPEPPRLLILAGWNFSTPEDRRERWRETLVWARDYGVPVSVVEPSDAVTYRG